MKGARRRRARRSGAGRRGPASDGDGGSGGAKPPGLGHETSAPLRSQSPFMKILVTGGTGYIGNHTAKFLAAAEHQPVVDGYRCWLTASVMMRCSVHSVRSSTPVMRPS